jgi:hypothetical protein
MLSLGVAYFIDNEFIIAALSTHSFKTSFALMFSQKYTKIFVAYFALLDYSALGWKLNSREKVGLHYR